MGKTSCEILFENNPNRVYYGGDVVKGTVIITLHKEKIIKGMTYCEQVTLMVKLIFISFLRFILSLMDNRYLYYHCGQCRMPLDGKFG